MKTNMNLLNTLKARVRTTKTRKQEYKRAFIVSLGFLALALAVVVPFLGSSLAVDLNSAFIAEVEQRAVVSSRPWDTASVRTYETLQSYRGDIANSPNPLVALPAQMRLGARLPLNILGLAVIALAILISRYLYQQFRLWEKRERRAIGSLRFFLSQR